MPVRGHTYLKKGMCQRMLKRTSRRTSRGHPREAYSKSDGSVRIQSEKSADCCFCTLVGDKDWSDEDGVAMGAEDDGGPERADDPVVVD